MHKYLESLHTFFWAVSGTRLDLSFSFRSVTFQVQMNLKGRLVFPNHFFPVGHEYEAADSDFFLLSPNILYCCGFCPLIAILFFSYFNDFWEDVSFICSVKCLTDLNAVSWQFVYASTCQFHTDSYVFKPQCYLTSFRSGRICLSCFFM